MAVEKSDSNIDICSGYGFYIIVNFRTLKILQCSCHYTKEIDYGTIKLLKYFEKLL